MDERLAPQGPLAFFTFTARRRWLVAGRERIYFEHFWNDFAADPAHSVSEADRQLYAAAYAQSGAMKAGFEVFRAFEQDAKDFTGFAETKLTMPIMKPWRSRDHGHPVTLGALSKTLLGHEVKGEHAPYPALVFGH